ncbi:site-specific integrase, partial [Acinetobacter lwoffii]|uniref:site-specific integrase n=2 Tax=Acinetobacter lwoffii TaxID=28090 RepID=UPI0012BA68E5
SITDVNQLDMIEIRNDRLSKVSTSTVKCDLGALGSVFKYARQELRILKTSPLIDVAKPTQAPHRERRITQDEIETILTGFKYHSSYQPTNKRQQVAWAFLFALETAMRASEIVSMQWCNVFDDHVLLPDTKNGTARKVPLSKKARELIELMRGMDADKVLTISDRSNALSHDFWLVVSNRLGITDLNFHDTRHEATTRLANKLPIQDLAKVTGHKDLKMLMRYYNPTVQELAQRLNEENSNIIQFQKAVG